MQAVDGVVDGRAAVERAQRLDVGRLVDRAHAEDVLHEVGVRAAAPTSRSRVGDTVAGERSERPAGEVAVELGEARRSARASRSRRARRSTTSSRASRQVADVVAGARARPQLAQPVLGGRDRELGLRRGRGRGSRRCAARTRLAATERRAIQRDAWCVGRRPQVAAGHGDRDAPAWWRRRRGTGGGRSAARSSEPSSPATCALVRRRAAGRRSGGGGTSPSAAPTTTATSTSRPAAPASVLTWTPSPTLPRRPGVISSSATNVARNSARVTGWPIESRWCEPVEHPPGLLPCQRARRRRGGRGRRGPNHRSRRSLDQSTHAAHGRGIGRVAERRRAARSTKASSSLGRLRPRRPASAIVARRARSAA